MENAVVTTENPQEIIATLTARNAELEALVKYYEEQLRLAKHRQFGSSNEKGEVPEQLGLFDEAENIADPKQPEPELEEITYKRKKRVGKREDDLSSLPVEVIEYALPQSEPVIRGSLASPSAVAHIMAQKYVMCVPLYRQEQAWLRDGISLSRQTMANWVVRCSEDWLEPLYGKMKAQLLTHAVLHAVETVCQVLLEPGKKANTNSYMWHYRTSGDAQHPIILYEYQPTRSSAHPKRFLSGWKGYLHADGYKGYHDLPPEITVIGCWVHLRQKFDEALKATPIKSRPQSLAPEAIKRLGVLFHLETLWKDTPPDERQELRLKESKPLAEAFFAGLDSLDVLPKTPMGVAIHYALGQRRWLMNFYLDGRCELSNNRAENSIRPFVMGRKNWLFCNTQKGARASAVVYSIIETAKSNGLIPFEYLRFLFETVPNTTTGMLERLLPWGDAVPDDCRMSSYI